MSENNVTKKTYTAPLVDVRNSNLWSFALGSYENEINIYDYFDGNTAL